MRRILFSATDDGMHTADILLTIQYSPHIVVFTLFGKLEIMFIAERENEEIGLETELSREKQQKLVKSSDHPNISENW